MLQTTEQDRRLSVKYGKLRPGAEAQTVFIAAQDRDASKRWIACGTGFPVYFDGRVFIVTAAHNFKGMTDEPALLIGPNGYVRLFRDNFHLVGNTAVDLALIAMNSGDLITLFGECMCLQLDMKALPGRTEPHAYQAYGYPVSKNKHSKTKGWPMAGWRITLGPAAPVPSRSKLNLLEVPLLGFEIDLGKMVNDDGEPDNRIGKLEGISGGPVVSHAITENTVGPGLLAGVFLEWHAIERVAVVMPAIAIAASIQNWYPTA